MKNIFVILILLIMCVYNSYAATITSSIGTRTAENVNITNVTGSGPYTVTLASSTTTTDNGDTLTDEAGTPDSFLITAGAGTSSLTVEDAYGVGAGPDFSATSQATTIRSYSTIQGWEDQLDNTSAGNIIYAASDDAVGEIYNDSAFNESVTINGGGTVNLNSIKLTVPSSERHDGTAGSGSRIVKTSNNGLSITTSVTIAVEWLEIDMGGNGNSAVFLNSSSGAATLDKCIIHDIEGIFGVSAINHTQNMTVDVLNTIVYDVTAASGSNTLDGIVMHPFSTTRVLNSTFHNFVHSGTGAAYGIGFADDTDNTVRNTIVTGASSGGSAADFEQSSPSNATVNYCLSSDTSASGTGSLTSKTAANQFVSTTSGSEDLHLKRGADAIGVGVDLASTPTGINTDIDGRDRHDFGIWDIGADLYAKRFMSIGTRSAENVNINSVAGSGPYTVTLASATTTTDNGDELTDEAASANSYLIVAGAGTTSLTVVDVLGAGTAPSAAGSTQATTKRKYSTIQAWEDDLDDTNIYGADDIAQGEAYNDSAFNEDVTINGGSTVGLSSTILTVPSGERHDGTAGNGARIVRSAVGTGILMQDDSQQAIVRDIEWLELDGGGFAFRWIVLKDSIGTIRNLIAHDINRNSFSNAPAGIDLDNNSGTTQDVLNTIIYDVSGDRAGDNYGINTQGAANVQAIYNCTIHNVQNNSASNNAYGIGFPDDADKTIRNTIVTDTGGSSSGTKQDYQQASPGAAITSNNIASDTSASGTDSHDSESSSSLFVSTTGGSEDLHLASGATNAIDGGTDLGTSPYLVQIDIDGRDRDSESDTWDIGADEFIAAVSAFRRQLIMII